MITRYYEIYCDCCKGADYFPGTKAEAIEQFKEVGWIFVGDKQYCTTECRDKPPEDEKNKPITE